MKLAISGKGGVGKTTLAALLCHLYAREGRRVLAVDADPDANLGSALGVAPQELQRVAPIAGLSDLVRERTGAEPGRPGQFFLLNPRVDDIPERFWLERGGIRLLVMGGVKGGGGGCACPENALVQALLRHLLLERSDTVIVDLEAGLEHLGRGTARGVDALLVVVEPGRRSFQTAASVFRLASDLGVPRVMAVGNKARPGEEEAIRKGVGDIPLLGVLPFDPEAARADLEGLPPHQACPALLRAAAEVKSRLDQSCPG
ncbi:MAG: AAA family ATPase [Acetobacteraceae bacterium]|nr:AAA family ATPase [Acetobacteraceae bacterium]